MAIMVAILPQTARAVISGDFAAAAGPMVILGLVRAYLLGKSTDCHLMDGSFLIRGWK